ncbi:MAG TPA: hypothetical protein VJ499_06855 [Flavisolibacter sp.]|nr:hypothetical protein [Flavisolibacter sp.]
MKKELQFLICLFAISCMAATCKKQSNNTPVPPVDSSLVNLRHLDYLYTAFQLNGANVAGIYIYAEAPDYHLVADADEGFTCVDDVARALQVYCRNKAFDTDTAIQNKALNLTRFLLEMQSANGYFYNFVFPNLTINTNGSTSVNTPNWWSWRALYALSESMPKIRTKDVSLASRMEQSVEKLVTRIKADLVNISKDPEIVSGIIIPKWLPAGSGTDQAAIMILGLIPYASANNDAVIRNYIQKLADGIALMQEGDATHFPYSCILSWANTWHAYGSDQAYALMKAGQFLGDPGYTAKGMAEVDNFYPWLLKNGMKSSFVVESNGSEIRLSSEKTYEQIAYGIRPMVTAATEAYRVTKDEKYADLAGHLAAWFLGANDAQATMYASTTGRGFDGIQSSSSINRNSGAESTIESLLAMQLVEAYPSIKTALLKYKK